MAYPPTLIVQDLLAAYIYNGDVHTHTCTLATNLLSLTSSSNLKLASSDHVPSAAEQADGLTQVR